MTSLRIDKPDAAAGTLDKGASVSTGARTCDRGLGVGAATRIRASVTARVDRLSPPPRGLRFFATIVHDGTNLLAVCGELDASNSHRMLEHTWGRPDNERALIVDLSGLTFLSAAGLRVLDTLGERFRGSAIRWIVIPSPAVRRLLDLCDPPVCVPTAESVSAALNIVEP